MPQAGFEPTEVGVTGFQLNTKRMLYLQATMAGCLQALFAVEYEWKNWKRENRQWIYPEL